MRQQYKNTGKKGRRTTYPKTQYQPKSSSQSQMHSRKLKCLELEPITLLESNGVGCILADKMFHPEQNIQLKVRLSRLFCGESGCSVDGSVQHTGKTRTALCTALSGTVLVGGPTCDCTLAPTCAPW